MDNSTILIKIKNRLNKLSSNDFDNIPSWQITESFNKGMVDWCRRNLHGSNTKGEGDGQSTSRIDDLQSLLVPLPIPQLVNRQTFYETIQSKPVNYLRYKRLSAKAKSDCCGKAKRMKIYLAEEADIDILLSDVNKRPSFEWAETFATFIGDKIRIYTNGDFEVLDVILTYYRQPRRIEIAGVRDSYTGLIPTVDVESEFNDDLTELFIDEAMKILAGDIESWGQFDRGTKSVEGNN